MAKISETTCELKSRYFIVRADKGNLLDLFKFLVSLNSKAHEFEFLERSEEEEEEEDDEWGPMSGDHRWVIVISIIIMRIIAIFGKPMEWNGVVIEFLLNLFRLNGGIHGFMLNLIKGKVVVPRRGSNSFISAIGHLDPRVDLFKGGDPSAGLNETWDSLKGGDRALMDLCILASKIAYENANVVKHIVVDHWKMHFVEFYNCWNDYQKQRSTQVFIFCDKPKDASLVLISFRGTDPFAANDWSTDVDYSWYEIPKLGKVHMGFLEALGLGNRDQASTFHDHLRPENQAPVTTLTSGTDHTAEDKTTAYYAVRNRLRSLLHEHKKAKFVMIGHSLGGALAVLFPAILLLHEEHELMKRLLAIYTFGQPRVGDRKLGKFMEAHLCRPVPKYFRVVYSNDIVPRLPYDDNTFLYKHFGLCLYYNSVYTEQNVEEEPNRNYFGLRYLIPLYLNAVWELIRGLTSSYIYGPEYREGLFSIFFRVFGLFVPGVSAHSPREYVNCVRLGRGMVQMAGI